MVFSLDILICARLWWKLGASSNGRSHKGIKSHQDSFMWGSYSVSVLTIIGSNQVPVHAWKNAWRGTCGLFPPVKLNVTIRPVLCWCYVKKPKQRSHERSINNKRKNSTLGLNRNKAQIHVPCNWLFKTNFAIDKNLLHISNAVWLLNKN
jgi:hypothetical protein